MTGNPAAQGNTFWWIAGIGLVLVTGLSLSWCYWEELHSDQESLSATVRNVGVVIGGVIAILFAVWRSIVAARQATTAQRGLRNERYQKGAEMLGSKVLAVRLGGIYALARLAREYPEDYHVQIMSLLCAFVRKPPVVKTQDTCKREDVQAVMAAVCARSAPQIEIEKKEYCPLGFVGADLSGVNFLEAGVRHLDLRSRKLTPANMERALLQGANLEGAVLAKANLKDAHLSGANFERACLIHANLTGADLKGCKGLTQEQIDEAVADPPDNPPDLTDAVDDNTGEPLVWRRRERETGTP